MRKRLLTLLALLFLIAWPHPATAQEATPTPETQSSSNVETPTTTAGGTALPASLTPVIFGITDPLEGANLNGVVSISGIAPGAWDLAFAYRDDSTGIWFPLASSSEAVTGILLPAWDTTPITDGFYTLRLRLFSAESAVQETKVNIRIRNYTALETPTPSPEPSSTVTFTPPPATRSSSTVETPTATETPADTPAPPLTTPTPLPPNPATLAPQDIALNFGKGALAVAATFAFFGFLLTVSKKLRS